MMFSYYIIYTNHFDMPSVKSTIGKINNLAIATSLMRHVYQTSRHKLVSTKSAKYQHAQFAITISAVVSKNIQWRTV